MKERRLGSAWLHKRTVCFRPILATPGCACRIVRYWPIAERLLFNDQGKKAVARATYEEQQLLAAPVRWASWIGGHATSA